MKLPEQIAKAGVDSIEEMDAWVFENVVNKDGMVNWDIHYISNENDDLVVAPIKGWTNLKCNWDLLEMVITYQPNIFKDGTTDLVIKFRDKDSMSQQREFFIDHYGK